MGTGPHAAPYLKFVIKKVNSDIRLKVTGPDNVVRGTFYGKEAVLRERNRAMRDDLVRLKSTYPQSGTYNVTQAIIALGELIQAGGVYLSEIFKRDATYIMRLLDQCLGAASEEYPARLDMVCSEEHAVMLGLIPAKLYKPVAIKDLDALRTQASMLPLFSAVLRQIRFPQDPSPRDPQDPSPQDPEVLPDAGLIPQDHRLVASPRIPLLFLWDEDAPGSRDEKDLLQRPTTLFNSQATEPLFQFDEFQPIPNENMPLAGVAVDDAEYRLAQLLASPSTLSRNGHGAQLPFQLVHLTAHSAVGQPGNRAFSEIVLSRVRYQRRWGVLRALPAERFSITNGLLKAAWDCRRLDLGPMAILSSCESGALATEGALSIAGALLQFGYRAVLGTETRIGGKVSTEFFKAFYQQLLNGAAAGEAVRRARWHLLLGKDHNPLGCLFVLHGDPELKVSQQEANA